MDCECEDGIPGSDLNVETGRSWFSIRLRTIESIEFRTDPIAAHKASASCLQRMTPPKRAATSHLLCESTAIKQLSHKRSCFYSPFFSAQSHTSLLLRNLILLKGILKEPLHSSIFYLVT